MCPPSGRCKDCGKHCRYQIGSKECDDCYEKRMGPVRARLKEIHDARINREKVVDSSKDL